MILDKSVGEFTEINFICLHLTAAESTISVAVR